MKNFFPFVLTMLVILTASACGTKAPEKIGLDMLPKDYSVEISQKNNDVTVDGNGKIFNADKFEKFLKSIKENKKGNVRITKYTDEGKAIIYDLDSNGKSITLTVDSTRDSFGVQEIKKYDVSKITDEAKDKGTFYKASTKDGEIPLVLIP